MANVPTIPPLLSTTPPPIDFEDDSGLPPTPHNLDDEFGDFAIAEEEDLNDDTLNVNVMSLPVTPLHQENLNVIEAKYPNVTNYDYCDPFKIVMHESFTKVELPIDNSNDIANKTNSDECFDEYEIMQNEVSTQKITTDELLVTNKNAAVEVNNIIEDSIGIVARNADVSLDQDITKEPCSVIDDNLIEKEKITNMDNSSLVICTKNNVILEDILDDSSDDENINLKRKIFNIDENSEDFFKIHALENTKKTSADENTLQNQYFQHNANIPLNESVLHNENIVQNKNIMEEEIDDIEFVESIENIDCNDFACFDKANSNVQDATYDNIPFTPISNDITFKADFDQFYSQPSITNSKINSPNSTTQKTFAKNKSSVLEDGFSTITADDSDNADGSDDDFGEFTDSTSNQVPSNNLETNIKQTVEKKLNLNLDNVNERLNHVLEIMFPKSVEKCLDYNVTRKDFNINPQLHSIDSAKALEYQWVNSQMRDALIKSLGIDCRNILFGEKWNSSMPRFAANLSYDPLQPTKSLSSTLTHELQHSKDRSQSQSSKSTDIPTVEFDWHTSGLVNPLEGKKILFNY
ncbi:aftiphilin-like [Teleopsis dalmanni]|uniref:aftiphilin-like n=1 Tax=Teleopsis dalmanni TaxID=139649 RepID=UPI0018CF9325|nr:aftiphilin-like [Teleopsis dalmanni]